MAFTRGRKRILAALVATIALLLASQWLLGMVDTQKMIAPLREQVEALVGQPLIMEEVSVHLLTGPRVEIHQIAIRPRMETAEPYLFYAQKLVIPLSLSDIFSDEPSIDALEVTGLRLYLEKNRRGIKSWQFLDEIKQKVSQSLGFAITLRDSSFRYADFAKGAVSDIDAINGTLSFDPNHVQLQLNARLNERVAQLNARCSVHQFLRLNSFDTRCEGRIEGDGLSLSGNQRMLMRQGTLQSRGDISIRSDDMRPWLDAFVSQNRPWMMAYAEHPIPVSATVQLYSDSSKTVANIRDLVMDETRGQVSIADEAGGGVHNTEVNAQFSLLDMQKLTRLIRRSAGTDADLFALKDGFHKQRRGSIRLQAKQLRYHGLMVDDLSLTGRFDRGEIALTDVRGELPGGGSLFSLGQLSASAKGLQYSGVVEASGEQMAALMPLLGHSPTAAAAETFGAYRARFNALLSPAASILSEIRIIAGDDIRVAGGLSALRKPVPRIEGNLAIQNIDLSALVKQWQRGVSLESPPEQLSSNPFRFAWLRRVSQPMDIQLKLGNYRLYGVSGKAMQAALSVEAGRLALSELIASVNGETLAGDIEVRLPDGELVPQLNTQLNLSVLHLGNWLRSGLWYKEDYALDPLDNSIWNKQTFNPSPLKHLNGRHELKVGHLTHEVFEGKEAHLDLELADGVLTIHRWQMGLYDGLFSASGLYDARLLPSLQLQLSLVKANLAQVLAPWVAYRTFNGRLALNASVSTSGVNVAEWVKHLKGTLNFDARNVTIRNLNLASLMRSINSVRSVAALSSAVRQAFSSGSTSVAQVKGATYFEDARLKTTQITLQSGQANGQMRLEWDLARWMMQAAVNIGLKAVSESNYPFLVLNFEGPLESPERQLDVKSLEAYIAQRQR